MTEQTVRVRATARGRVQMVGYRAFATHHGSRLGLRGTVRNLPTGEVECVVEGETVAVEELLDHLRRGPAHAQVDALDVVSEQSGGALPPMKVMT